MIRLRTGLAALAALFLALSAVLSGGAGAQALHNPTQQALSGAMDDALVGPERPVWTRAVGDSRDGDSAEAVVAVRAPELARAAWVWSAPGVVADARPELTRSPPARGPPTRGT